MRSNWKSRIALLVGIGLVTLCANGRVAAFKMAPSITGAKVTSVTSNSPALRIGLEPGDVIVGIDNQPIRTTDDLARLLAGNSKPVLIIRDMRTGKYSQWEAKPINGKIGIRAVMTTVPEVVLPPLGDVNKR
jgi:membrane-associated protease RseP (regulator of RpoE activity)